MELEKELKARIFLHQVTIVKSMLVGVYIENERKRGGIALAEPMVKKNAMDYADKTLVDIMSKGNLKEAYEEAWEAIGSRLPDNYCILK